MTAPIDQTQRARFVTEVERNFSVVASAGSGKTRAITDRIVALARHDRALDWLPALVVVTYTNRAAAEMQQRARQSIIEADVRPEVLAAFNRAFFGTIHSLCMRLLRQHGHHLNLPTQLEHLDESNDAALWTEFIQQQTTLGGSLDEPQRHLLLRLVSARTLLELGRKTHRLDAAPLPSAPPVIDFASIHAFPCKAQSLAAATRCRDALRRWENAWTGGGFVGSLPPCESKPLRETWEAATAPLRAWIQRAALHVATETARSYRDFRLQHGAMTYADQVALAAALLQHSEAARRIRAKQFRVILDEAQDTDPTQFDVLLEMARPPDAAGAWSEEGAAPPRAGHFCMVGDFQQSIYGERADLGHYQRVHDALHRGVAGEALEFSVTFRLDQKGIDWINAAFPDVLHGKDRQVFFVPLNPRPTVLPGQVARCELGEMPDVSDWRDWQKARWEAERLAHWISDQGPEKLRASSWSEVALLCPRTRWLPVLRASLQKLGLKAQVQSERAIKGDSAAYAWFTALVVALAEPRNGYEIVGVLREVFGRSDQELADFARGEGERFHLTGPTTRGGPVAAALNELTALRERLARWPLFSAIEEMVDATQLRERLAVLEKEDVGELDALLTCAAAAEACGATLGTFAADLRTGFHDRREVQAVDPDAVQIISGHKAKGSEWDAVIVPFFARGVQMRSPGYPRSLRDPRTSETMAALDGGDIGEELKAALEAHARQELERGLYVALTRARHTLVLVDDRTLFCGKNGLPKHAQGQLLRCAASDTLAAIFDQLPASLTTCEETGSAQKSRASARVRAQRIAPLPPFAAQTFETGRARAALFLKRNPSALAEAALAEANPVAAETAPPRATGPNSGLLYGAWWHSFIEHLDWPAGSASWDAAFAAALDTSPDADLSRREWALLRAQLASDSPFSRQLTAPGLIAHAELPFLWAMSADECLEGIIDLAIFDPAAGAWLILDWKTNRTRPDELPALHAHYLPQLSAYWRAVSAMLDAPVSAGLYSTATGSWLVYEEPALAASWAQLSHAPAALAAALSEP